ERASAQSAFGIRQVDGAKLRAWFEANQGKITEIFGKKQAQALDNFTIYAKYMTGAVERSASSRTFDPLVMGSRIVGEAVATAKNPLLMIPGETSAFVLARGLSD